MKKRLLFLLAVMLCALDLNAQKVVFMPQWTPQTQFAGYYIAKEKGFYEQEGLDVDIQHIGQASTLNIAGKLNEGKVQIVGQQLMQSVISRSAGMPLVNVMQLTQVSGLWCVSRNPISTPDDLDGLKVGKWKVGYSDFCEMLEVANGISINWVPFISGINLYIFGAVDAMLCYSYSEFAQLELALGEIPDDHVIKFSDFGYDCPEDGLYVTEKYYDANRETIEKFVRASKRGWEYAREHKDTALEVTWKYIKEANVVTNLAHQRRMLDEYLTLMVNPVTGVVDYAPVRKEIFDVMVDALVSSGSIVSKVEYEDFVR